jgi:hypothetical protein
MSFFIIDTLFGPFAVKMFLLFLSIFLCYMHGSIPMIWGGINCIHFQIRLFICINYIMLSASRNNDRITIFHDVFVVVNNAFPWPLSKRKNWSILVCVSEPISSPGFSVINTS